MMVKQIFKFTAKIVLVKYHCQGEHSSSSFFKLQFSVAASFHTVPECREGMLVLNKLLSGAFKTVHKQAFQGPFRSLRCSWAGGVSCAWLLFMGLSEGFSSELQFC